MYIHFEQENTRGIFSVLAGVQTGDCSNPGDADIPDRNKRYLRRIPITYSV